MPEIDWTDILDAPDRFVLDDRRWRIAGVRHYRNPNGHQCVEFTLENSDGWTGRRRYSLEVEHRRISNCMFLQPFLTLTFAEGSTVVDSMDYSAGNSKVEVDFSRWSQSSVFCLYGNSHIIKASSPPALTVQKL